ncbi:hypothetical protein [Microbacterium sp. A1-JK]|uniref:hypothetical protein n=1 Tax=Microbacterium sp. A1-JK TaxID=3177516 RepID=UPI0038858DAB
MTTAFRTRWFVPVLGVWMAMASSAIIVIGHHRLSAIAGAALLAPMGESSNRRPGR